MLDVGTRTIDWRYTLEEDVNEFVKSGYGWKRKLFVGIAPPESLRDVVHVFLRRMVIPSRREHLGTPIKRHKLEGEFTGQFDADERNVRDEQGLFWSDCRVCKTRIQGYRKINTRGNVMATKSFRREIVAQFEDANGRQGIGGCSGNRTIMLWDVNQISRLYWLDKGGDDLEGFGRWRFKAIPGSVYEGQRDLCNHCIMIYPIR